MSETQSDITVVECPADGCDYTGPEQSVIGHYSGSRDDAHQGGYGYAQAIIRFDRE